MTLEFKHFDTRLHQWIKSENPSLVDEPILTEKLDNTLLELYFPNTPFSFGHIDEKSSVDDLYQHPDGHVLLLSSSSRLLYGSPDCLETIEKLCPDRKDRGAYGSIFLGSCSNAIYKEMNILVVDDATGENGGVLPDDVAWKQVGDCHGKISPNLAVELSGTVEQVIQHRLGIPDQFRFAKGTLAPKNLSQLPYKEPNTKVDLIVPTSSFKGGDKKNNPISPGLHSVKVWIGEKERSLQGKVAISQAHASFPQGIKDYLKKIEKQAKELQKIQNDPRLLAEYYCDKHELRQSLQLDDSSKTIEQNREENDSSLDSGNNDLIYRIIKADLESGHGQLLETQKVTDELKRFVRKEWLEISIGKTISVDRGMIIPSKDLKHGEICVSWLGEGEEILNFRSPLLNSNGMCVSINKKVSDAKSPNGKPFEGVVVVNDEDHKRITERIKQLEQQGIETDEIDPIETESERQGRDYDGDCIGVALASDFPNLTAEAKRRNLFQNAYAPVKKEDKVSFYRSDGSQPPFESIALFMSDSISVGVINNHATALEALESEIDLLRKYGTFEQKSDYVRLVGGHYQKLIIQQSQREREEIVRELTAPNLIPPQYRSRIAQIAQISESSLTPESINTALAINRSIYHDMIGEAGYQNQLAVDIFKSNRAPDMAAIAQNNRLLHRIPNYIRDKKKLRMYINKGIEPQGVSPVELMVRQANTHFSESALVARPTEQFRDLFPEIYTPAQYNQALLAKASFDKLFNAASIANLKLRHETGPVLFVSTQSGKQLEITNLTKFDHPQAFSAKKLNIKLVENKSIEAYHKLLALAQVDGAFDRQGNLIYQKLGTVCEISRTELGLQAGMTTELADVSKASPLSKRQVQLKFQQADDYAESFANSIPDSERAAMAAATWHVCTIPDNRPNVKGANKISNFAFAAWGDSTIGQLKELQFTSFAAAELRQHNQTPDELWRNGSDVSLEVKAIDDQRFWFVNDPIANQSYQLGVLSPKGAQLPVGTTARGVITGDTIATATLTIPGIDQPITFGKMGEHEFRSCQFNGESVKVTISAIAPQAKPILKLDGKEIGELDSRSQEMLAAANRLKEGQRLDVTLNTFGTDSGTYTLATTALGNTIRVNRQAFAAHQNQRFTGETITVELGFKQSKPAMGVFLDVDGTTKLAGIFTNNHKSSKEALMKAGLWKDEATFDATITSNITIAKITIDPNSVNYPALGKWQTPESDRNLKEATPIDKIADRFLDALKKQPSLLHRQDAPWQLQSGETKEFPTLGLTVDESVAQATSQWLKAQNIPHQQIDRNDPSVTPETQRGYAVFRMIETDVSPSVLQSLEKQCGEVLDAVAVDEAMISPYHQKLETISVLVEAPQPNRHGANTQADQSPSDEIARSEIVSPFEQQNKRTQILAPVLAQSIKTDGKRDSQGEYIFQSQDYITRWNPQHRLMTLFSRQETEPLLQARYDDATKTWESIPLTKTIDGKVQPRLSAEDMEKLDSPQLSYSQLFEQFSSQLPRSNSRDFLLSVAEAALSNGYSSEETLKILESSSFYQRVGQKLDAKEAQNFLENIVDIAAYQQQHGQLSTTEQLKQNFGPRL